MTTNNTPHRSLVSLVAGFGLVFGLALVPAAAEAANPVAQPNIIVSPTIPEKLPGEQIYVLKIGKGLKQIKGKTVKVNRAKDGTVTGVWVDATKLIVAPGAVVSVAIAMGNGSSSNNNNGGTAQASTSTTITQLPGGGTRIDTTNGDGSTSTTINDPNGGKNGGSRTTTSTTDTEGNTTTTTTTTDGGDGSTTTTTTTSP